jgi:hypothetical protein
MAEQGTENPSAERLREEHAYTLGTSAFLRGFTMNEVYRTKALWLFPDDSRKWNAYGGITSLLEDGDLIIGGAFAVKRVTAM